MLGSNLHCRGKCVSGSPSLGPVISFHQQHSFPRVLISGVARIFVDFGLNPDQAKSDGDCKKREKEKKRKETGRAELSGGTLIRQVRHHKLTTGHCCFLPGLSSLFPPFLLL